MSRENNFSDSDLVHEKERETERERERQRDRERERKKESKERESQILARPMGFAHFCSFSQLPTTSLMEVLPKSLPVFSFINIFIIFVKLVSFLV